MGFKTVKVEEEMGANLVPMIDIMFLLLLFFMLNADMSQRDLEEVTTPIANQAQEDKADEGADRITCNVFYENPGADGAPVGGVVDWPRWKISVGGQHYQPLNPPDTPGGHPIPREADLKKLQDILHELSHAKREYLENPNDAKSASKRGMLIRADRGAPWGAIQRALERAALAGIYRTEVAVQIEKSSIKK